MYARVLASVIMVSFRGRVAALQEEIATLTQQTAAASERLKQLNKVVGGELRPRLAALREELKTVEVGQHTLLEDIKVVMFFRIVCVVLCCVVLA